MSSARSVVWVVLLGLVVVLMGVGVRQAESGPRSPAERAQHLKETTLCPVCDGQTVVESNVVAAVSIRALIDERVAAGDSDDEIRAAVEATFPGEAVSAIPPAEGLGALVWVLPVLALSLGATVLVLAFRRWAAQAGVKATEADRALVEAARVARAAQ